MNEERGGGTQKLHHRNDLGSSVILIQAEAIKKYIADRGVVQSRIESIYDIYELYAKYQGHGKLFERSTFDLAVVCGNLTIIIDGLDELSSLFQDKFDAGAFLESLKQLHDQLGSCHIPDDHKDAYERDEDGKRTSLSCSASAFCF